MYLQLTAVLYDEVLKTIGQFKKDYLNKEASDYVEKNVETEILRAHALAGKKQFKDAFRILDQQRSILTNQSEEIFGSNTRLWLKFSLLYAYAEISFEKNTKSGQENLDALIAFVSEHQSNIQYSSMYAETRKLLIKTNNQKQLDDLPKPAN